MTNNDRRPSASGASGSTRYQRRDIQGLRAVAVLVVVAFHAGLKAPGGFVGVDVFFVISGFVITGMLQREWNQNGHVAFSAFYLRRFKRLTPALAFMIAVTLLLSTLLLSPFGPQETAAKTGVGAMFLVANVVIRMTTGGYFDAAAETNPLLHTWSLSVEEQFYLVFPALLALGWTAARRRSPAWLPGLLVAGFAAVSFGLAVLGPGILAWAGPLFKAQHFVFNFYSPFTRAWEFAVGALLALAMTRYAPRSPNLVAALGVVGICGIAASVAFINSGTPFPGIWTLLPVTSTLMLLWAGAATTTPSTRILSASGMVKIGDWSYSIYLWHWPFIVFARALWPGSQIAAMIAALLSFLPAVASYRWLEQPIRNMNVVGRLHWARLIATAFLPPVLIAGGLSLCVSHGWWSTHVNRIRAAAAFSAVYGRGCTGRTSLDATPDRCKWFADARGKPIYLVGDSHASQFSEPMVEVARDLHRPLIVATTRGCPFLDFSFRDTRPDQDNDACQRYVQRSTAFLEKAPQGLVVIALTNYYWSSDSFYAGKSPEDVSNVPDRKLEAFAFGLRRTVEALRTAGQEVLLIQTIPRWVDGLWDTSRCSLLRTIRGDCMAERSLEFLEKNERTSRSIVEGTARDLGARVWDPGPLVCPQGMCSTEGPDFVRYRDPDHISVKEAITLAPELERVVASTGG